ncbi:MAG: hypothetical protein RIK87_00550 [Fuerstiella sp.]
MRSTGFLPLLISAMVSVAVVAIAVGGASDGQSEAPVTQTLLLVDDHHVLYRSGTKRVFHAAMLNPTNPVIREDRAWEMAIGWTSIYRDPRSGTHQLAHGLTWPKLPACA